MGPSSVVRHPLPALEPSSQLPLGATQAAVGAAISVDGSYLAVLLAEGQTQPTRTTGADTVTLVDLKGQAMVASTSFSLPPGGPGIAEQLKWLDPDTLAVIRTYDPTMWLDVVDVDGRLLSSTEIGRGWGGAVVGGRLLRLRDDGLQAVGRDGTIEALTPQLTNINGGVGGFISPTADGPVIPASRPDPPQRRPVAASNVPAPEAPAGRSGPN